MISKSVRTTLVAIMGLAIGAAAFAATAKKADPPKSAPAPMDSGTIAVIGDTKITEADLMSSLPPDRQQAFTQANQRIQETERGAMTEVFAQRYVEQQAKAKGISEDDFYAQEIAANKDTMPAEYKVQVAQIKQQIYDAKRMALDDLIGKRLEEKTAKDRNTTVDELVKTEVDAKVAPVTQADIDQYYTQNQRMFGGQAKEAVSKQIEDNIKNTRATAKRAEWRNSLRASNNVRVNLEVPRISVSLDDDPTRGPKDAPVQIVMFSDFQCPFCSRVEATIKQVRDTYGDKVAVTFRDYPLSFHQNAEKAAEAANCANKQGKYWEFHDSLFANQAQLSVADLKKKAEDMKLDTAAFNQCLDSGEMKAEIDKDTKEGSTYGVTGTPASFVNGRFLSGAQPYDAFKKVIDDELMMKGIAVPTAQATTPVADTTTVKR
jgi:protein-disulfide isomerase